MKSAYDIMPSSSESKKRTHFAQSPMLVDEPLSLRKAASYSASTDSSAYLSIRQKAEYGAKVGISQISCLCLSTTISHSEIVSKTFLSRRFVGWLRVIFLGFC